MITSLTRRATLAVTALATISVGLLVAAPAPPAAAETAAELQYGATTFLPLPLESFRPLRSLDLDSDGDQDLLTLGQRPQVLLNDGLGAFSASALIPGSTYSEVDAADLDRDGDLDLVLSDGGRVRVQFGRGDGTFFGIQDVPTAGEVRAQLGDLDQDGVPDLIVAEPSRNRIRTFAGLTSGVFADSGPTYPTSSGPKFFVTADVDRDGHVDVVVGHDSARGVSVRRGTGIGTLGDERFYATGQDHHLLQVADLNGDGALDVVTGSPSGSYTRLLGDGGGGFTAPLTMPAAGTPRAFVVRDLDDNGVPDLLTGMDKSFSYHLGVGDGTFASAHLLSSPGGSGVDAADFDGDGLTDVALGLADGVRILFRGANADTTPPTLAPQVAPNPVLLNGTATASPNASDASGIASSSCTQPVTSSVGLKTVDCTATDTAGNTATSAAVDVTVDNPEPPAQFTATPTTVTIGQVVTFTDAHPGGHRRTITYGDGTTASSRKSVFTKSYSAAGSYLVTLNTIDLDTDLRADFTLTITVAAGITSTLSMR